MTVGQGMTQVGGDGGGGGGGGVTNVTASSPLASSGGTTPNISGAVWGHSAAIPAAIANPELAQAPAVTGGGQPITVRTQAAASGSSLEGGPLYITVGESDDALLTGTVLFGSETAAGGTPPTSSYFGALDLTWHRGSGVVIANFGRGTNAIGAGVAGVEISAFSLISLATEGSNSPINIQPASSFGGQSYFSFAQDPTTGEPALVMMKSPGDAPALSGVMRLAWDESATAMGILVQRNVSNVLDLEIISRHLNELYLGNYNEDWRIHANTTLLFELFHQGGNGYVFGGPVGQSFAVTVDSQQTVSFGGNAGKDQSCVQGYSGQTTTTTPSQPIVTGPTGILLTDNAVTKLVVEVVAVDQVTQEFSSFRLAATFKSTAGVLSGSTTLAGTVSDADHSAGAAAVAPAFNITANKLNILATPWSANNTHWYVSLHGVRNTGTL